MIFTAIGFIHALKDSDRFVYTEVKLTTMLTDNGMEEFEVAPTLG